MIEDPTADPSDESVPARTSSRRTVELVALVVALMFLGGAIGYVVGVRGSDPRSSGVDVGFMIDMSDHHDQAVRMAIMELAHGQDQTVRGFAQDVLLFQRSELGAMGVHLANQGAVRPELDPERIAMSWMGMATPVGEMPGMATDAQLDQLDAARGLESDRLFLELMSAHHEGGLHMAEFAAAHATDPEVRALAQRMAQYQAVEVREYAHQQERLGLDVTSTTSTDAQSSDTSMPGMGH